MTDLDNTELMLARGKYSTIRAEHESAKQQMQILVGTVTSLASQVLKGVQPRDEAEVIDVGHLLTTMRFTTDEIDRCVMRIAELAKERAALKPLAWGKQ